MQYQRQSAIAEAKRQTEIAQRAGDFPAQEQAARSWLLLDPTQSAPWESAAEAALAMGNPSAAAGYLRGVPSPKPLHVYLQLGYLEMEALDDPLGCLKTCLETLESYPEDPETHERLLYIYAMTGQRHAVTSQARKTIALGCARPATFAYLAAAKWLAFKNGFETNQRWLERHPDESLFEIGAVVHMPSYPFLDVLAAEENAAGEEPRPLEYYARQVRALRQSYADNAELLAIELQNAIGDGNIDRVEELLPSVDAEMGEDNRFWRAKGAYFAAKEQWAEAEKAFRQSLELEPLDWSTQLEMASLKRRTEGIDAATQWQEKSEAGKNLVAGIQNSPNLQELTPSVLYQQMEDYFRRCDQGELADSLKQCLERSGN